MKISGITKFSISANQQTPLEARKIWQPNYCITVINNARISRYHNDLGSNEGVAMKYPKNLKKNLASLDQYLCELSFNIHLRKFRLSQITFATSRIFGLGRYSSWRDITCMEYDEAVKIFIIKKQFTLKRLHLREMTL